MRTSPLILTSLALLGIGDDPSGGTGNKAWATELSPPAISGCLNPGQLANEKTAEAAVHSIYAAFEREGLVTGPGNIPDAPQMIDGKPAIVVFVLQRHDAEGTRRTDHILEILRDRIGLTTLFQEGISICPSTQTEVESQIAAWLKDLDSRCATPAELEIAKATFKPYQEYAPRLSNEQFPHSFGWESLHLDECVNSCLVTSWYLGLEIVRSNLGKYGQSPLTLDGKYFNLSVAQMMEASALLAKKYPDTFPKLELPEVRGTIADPKTGKSHEIYLVRELDGAFARYFEEAGEFFNHHQLRLRNLVLAGNLSRAFRQPGSDSTFAVVVGENHVLAADGLSAPQMLAELGIASVSVVARDPETVK